MAFSALTVAETDAKSPIDDNLTTKIKDDLDDLNSRVVLAGAAPFVFELQGQLQYMLRKRSICMGILNEEFTPQYCRFMLKKSGTSGQLAFDIRKHTSPKTPIQQIASQYTASTSSVSQQGSSILTQSIARFIAQIATQSITHAKAAANVESVVLLGDIDGIGTNLVQYNLSAAVDSDTVVGDGIVFASCTDANNNGTFTIVEVNRSGGNNVVVSNASGVAQTTAAGTGQLKIMSYNFVNPVDVTGFAAGYKAHFASHTDANNNGDLLVYAVNDGGNNIWVKNNAGVTQAGVAGTADTNFFTYAFTGAASSTDYVAGEKAKCAGHTSALDDGNLEIIAVNSGGNNVILYNYQGVVQGAAAGTVDTNRWAYNMPSDPSTEVVAGYGVYCSGHSTSANNGEFTVKEVTTSKIIVYNESGAVQVSAAGTVATTRKLIKFSSDQSANYTTDSYIEMEGCVDSLYNFYWAYSPLKVLAVNHGGGANYNVVVELTGNRAAAAEQPNPAGYVPIEMKSIFTAAPTLANSDTGLVPDENIVGTSTSFVTATTIAANTPVMLYITEVPGGDPQDLTVQIR